MDTSALMTSNNYQLHFMVVNFHICYEGLWKQTDRQEKGNFTTKHCSNRDI